MEHTALRLTARCTACCLLAALAGCQPPEPQADAGAAQPAQGEPSAPAEPAAAGAPADAEPRAPTDIDRRVAQIMQAVEADSAAVDPAAVGAIVVCAVCHGVNGEGNMALDAPRIGGLPAWYLARQLDYFRRGVRGGEDADKYGTQMRAVALSLEGDEAIADLARYISTLSPPYASDTVAGNAERGAELYRVCSACHGADGQGSEALNTPSLVGQHGWYVARQLQNFRSGLRGSHPDDVYGMQMMPIVQGTLTSDEQIADVAAYVRSLPRLAGQQPGAPAQPPSGQPAQPGSGERSPEEQPGQTGG